jgi:uncharacterized RDD family membrane protein YckC
MDQEESATGGPNSVRPGVSVEVKPHAYDPDKNPELFDGVLARRVIAFFIDIIIIVVPVAAAALFVAIFGFLTFGLGWILFFFLHAGSVIWAILYYGFTLGSPSSATIGMRVMDIELRTWYGAPCYFVLGAVHAISYWLSVSLFTPLVLLIGLFNHRSRLLHDFLLGTVVINSSGRAAELAPRN